MSDSLISVIALLMVAGVTVFVVAIAVASWKRAAIWRQVKRDAEAAAKRRTLTADHRRNHVA